MKNETSFDAEGEGEGSKERKIGKGSKETKSR